MTRSARSLKERYRRFLAVYQETSRAAWESVTALLGAVDAAIVCAIRDAGGATSDELEERLGLKHQTISAQIRHLTEAGVLYDSGARRPTRSGCQAIVWALMPVQPSLEL